MAKAPKRVCAFVMFAFVAGCGTYRESYWVNTSVDPKMQRHRFTLDSTECAAAANRLIPEPPQPQVQSGTVALNTPSGPVYGTYRSQTEGRPYGPVEGIEQSRREHARKNYAFACMRNRGWELRERPPR